MKTARGWLGYISAVSVLCLVLASCGSDSGSSGDGGATGGAGGATGGAGGATGGAGGASTVPTVGAGGWDCTVTSSSCDCTHSPATTSKTGTCTGTFPCCRLLSISAGLSWYCQCDQMADAACQADINMRNMLSPAWRVSACPVK